MRRPGTLPAWNESAADRVAVELDEQDPEFCLGWQSFQHSFQCESSGRAP